MPPLFVCWLYQRQPPAKPGVMTWYGRQDLNLHGCPLEPKGAVTTGKES